MTTILTVTLVVSWVVLAHVYVVLTTRIEHRDTVLDYVLRHFKLNTNNPYVYFQGFEEKRCMFCQHPEQELHAGECPWRRVRPFVQTVYSAVKKGL